MTGRRDMRISADAKQRVLHAARTLGYRPNQLARGLRSGLTHTIGLVSDTIVSVPYAGEVIGGSVTAALHRDHLLFVGETDGDRVVEDRVVQGMLDRGVDGFLYATMHTREAKPPAVVPDELEAGRTAARTLLGAGHRHRIALVGQTSQGGIAARRLAGVTEVLSQERLSLPAAVSCLWWPEPAHEAVRRFLAGGNRPTALICMNDSVAAGAYGAIQAAGLRIPDDVSVVSFGDSDLATWLHPQRTSIAIQHVELGRRAVELLLASPSPTGIERVPMLLRQRSSLGHRAAAADR